MKTAANFRKSSFSGGGADSNCVEVDGTLTVLRDSKNPTNELPVGDVRPSLMQALKAGRFDLPTS